MKLFPPLPAKRARPGFAVSVIPGFALLLSGCASQPPRIWKQASLPPSEVWAPQDTATNVQDWDRVAQKIADGLQADGLLPGGLDTGGDGRVLSTAQDAFYVRIQQDSPFLHQLSQALEAEIISRHGQVTTSPLRAYVIDLSVGVVRWSSRSSSNPYLLRREAVWGASIGVGDRIILAYREPFYIYDSDIALYENMPSAGEAFAGSARPLRYSVP